LLARIECVTSFFANGGTMKLRSPKRGVVMLIVAAFLAVNVTRRGDHRAAAVARGPWSAW
jgi:hypothetical protein